MDLPPSPLTSVGLRVGVHSSRHVGSGLPASPHSARRAPPPRDAASEESGRNSCARPSDAAKALREPARAARRSGGRRRTCDGSRLHEAAVRTEAGVADRMLAAAGGRRRRWRTQPAAVGVLQRPARIHRLGRGQLSQGHARELEFLGLDRLLHVELRVAVGCRGHARPGQCDGADVLSRFVDTARTVHVTDTAASRCVAMYSPFTLRHAPVGAQAISHALLRMRFIHAVGWAPPASTLGDHRRPERHVPGRQPARGDTPGGAVFLPTPGTAPAERVDWRR